MTKKRISRYSCLILSVICGLFVCTSAVFAAKEQSFACTTTVNYNPEIMAIVEVKVGSEGDYLTVFNNTSNTLSNASTYFYLDTPPSGANEVVTSTPVQFKVTNYTNKSISASVRLANSGTDLGISIPPNVFLCNDSNTTLSSVAISSSIATNGYAESNAFYIQALFPNTVVPFIVTLATTS